MRAISRDEKPPPPSALFRSCTGEAARVAARDAAVADADLRLAEVGAVDHDDAPLLGHRRRAPTSGGGGPCQAP